MASDIWRDAAAQCRRSGSDTLPRTALPICTQIYLPALRCLPGLADVPALRRAQRGSRVQGRLADHGASPRWRQHGARGYAGDAMPAAVAHVHAFTARLVCHGAPSAVQGGRRARRSCTAGAYDRKPMSDLSSAAVAGCRSHAAAEHRDAGTAAQGSVATASIRRCTSGMTAARACH